MATNVLRSKTVQLCHGGQIPLFGFGTFLLNGYEAVKNALETAISTGYRLIDTAQLYDNEAQIGRALKEILPEQNLSRQDIFLTTKVNPSNYGRERTRPSVIQSLEDLQVDSVDLLLLHSPGTGFSALSDPRNKDLRRETWQEVEKLKEEGLCHSIGISNFEIRHIEEMDQYAKILPSLNQCEFHPHLNRKDLVAVCRGRGIQFQAFTSVGRNDPDLINDPVIQTIATAHGATPHQILLAWPVAQDIGVIPKSGTPQRIISNFRALQVKLNPEEIEKIDSLNKGKPYSKCRPWDIA